MRTITLISLFFAACFIELTIGFADRSADDTVPANNETKVQDPLLSRDLKFDERSLADVVESLVNIVVLAISKAKEESINFKDLINEIFKHEKIKAILRPFASLIGSVVGLVEGGLLGTGHTLETILQTVAFFIGGNLHDRVKFDAPLKHQAIGPKSDNFLGEVLQCVIGVLEHNKIFAFPSSVLQDGQTVTIVLTFPGGVPNIPGKENLAAASLAASPSLAAAPNNNYYRNYNNQAKGPGNYYY